jgi:hypothetical protein
VLLSAGGAGAKEFAPGDVRVCDATRCVAVTKPDVVRVLARFYYTGPKPASVARPAWGAPAFELRYRNGYATGVVASARLDRFLSFGVYLERFRRGVWYRVPPELAQELRRLTAGLQPYRVTRALVTRSR